MNRRHSVLAAAALATLALSLAACGNPGTVQDGSRAELYDSVRGIASDSSMVVVVEVTNQEVIEKDIPYTLSSAVIQESFSPAGLASEVPAGAPKFDGTQIVVRQMGTADIETPYPILKPGQQYLLFLTPTMLEGDTGTQFYVTGGSAGIYNSEGEVFVHGPFDEGDTLPSKLTTKDLQN